MNLKKLWNPNDIDFEKLKSMSKKELDEHIHEMFKMELVRFWVNLTYSVYYLWFTGFWQNILVLHLT